MFFVGSRANQIAFYSDIDSAPVVQVARRKSITVIQDTVNYTLLQSACVSTELTSVM